MHAQKAIKSLAQKAREKKQILEYQQLCTTLSARQQELHNDNNGNVLIWDEELFGISTRILRINPDYYTIWNYRRRLLMKRFEEISRDEIQALCVAELRFAEECIKIQPKSYWVWNHRRWILEFMPEPEWKRELKLVSMMLDMDARNFHGWDYRRYIISKSHCSTPEIEFAYTTSKINQNFSNFSAWHYRGKNIPLVFKEQDALETQITEDLELVRNAVFTEPSDQSPWLYQRWLLGDKPKTIDVMNVSLITDPTLSTTILTAQFSEPVLLNNNPSTTQLFINNTSTPTKWTPVEKTTRYCSSWVCAVPYTSDATTSYKLILNGQEILNARNQPLSIPEYTTTLTLSNPIGQSTYSPKPLPNATIIQQELDSLRELIELEPDSKWPLLTLEYLLGYWQEDIDSKELIDVLDKLCQVDSYRKNYYKDLRTNYIIRSKLKPFVSRADGNQEDIITKSTLELNNLGLTYLPTISGNVAFVKRLDLSGNCFTHATRGFEESVFYFFSLRELILRDCGIKKIDIGKLVNGCKSLNYVDLRGNDVEIVGEGGVVEKPRRIVKVAVDTMRSNLVVMDDAGYAVDIVFVSQ